MENFISRLFAEYWLGFGFSIAYNTSVQCGRADLQLLVFEGQLTAHLFLDIIDTKELRGTVV
jgi:hypothetical protein